MALMWLEDAKKLRGIYTRLNIPTKAKNGRQYVKVDLDDTHPDMMECRNCHKQYLQAEGRVGLCECGHRLFQKPMPKRNPVEFTEGAVGLNPKHVPTPHPK